MNVRTCLYVSLVPLSLACTLPSYVPQLWSVCVLATDCWHAPGACVVAGPAWLRLTPCMHGVYFPGAAPDVYLALCASYVWKCECDHV